MKKILVSCIIAYFLLSCSQNKFSEDTDNNTDLISIKLLNEYFTFRDRKTDKAYNGFLGIYNNEVYLFLVEHYNAYLNEINDTRSTGITLEDSIEIIPSKAFL
jgi:hypothetical protein